MTKNEILETVCAPRDMVVHLREFTDGDSKIGNLEIRRAKRAESDVVIEFVRQKFGERWVRHVINGFNQSVIPIFIAADNELKGFACYDVARMKKGIFGPMGVSLTSRENGIGRTLLQRSLAEMQQLGYEYAVIGNAGPIEFYETACGAVVIPKPNI